MEAKVMITSDDDTKVRKMIGQVVEKVVKGYNPTKVILFGSYAYGQPTKDSDLDILVVTNRRFSPDETYKMQRESLGNFNIPVQLVCVSDEEFAETKDIIGGIAYPASKYGEILYEKS
jgi:predicted nucleotidyltransferase